LQNYTGIRELTIKDEDLQEFYEDGKKYNFYTNEFIKVFNENGEVIYLARWDGENVVQLKYKKMESDYFGDIKPLNDEQRFLFSLLQDDNQPMKLVMSPYGCGKTFISLIWALNEVNSKKSRYDSLRFIRNEIVALNSPSIGFLPADANSKMKPWALELADVLGGEDMLDVYIQQGKIKLENLGFCRGRSWDRSIIFVEECQNMSPYLLSLALSRCGRDSCFIAVGDMRQMDSEVFKKNSGVEKAVEKYKGNPLFGMVTLQRNERSEISSLADLLLED
jgi:PhoH-like ATPase